MKRRRISCWRRVVKLCCVTLGGEGSYYRMKDKAGKVAAMKVVYGGYGGAAATRSSAVC